MRIALDFDATLTRNMDKWLEFYNKKYHDNKIISDIKRWKFYEDFNITHTEFLDIMRMVWKNYQFLPPQEWDEGKYISSIRHSNTIDIVTGVEESYLYAVKNWLFMHQIEYDNIYHEENKAHLNYDIFIDDNPELARQLLGNDKKIMLMPSRPWNMSFIESGNIIRVYSWADIASKVNMIVGSSEIRNDKRKEV